MLIYMNKFMVQIFLMNRLVQVKTFISKNKSRKRFTDGLFKCFKNTWIISSTNFYIKCKNNEIDSTKYQFENSQILYNKNITCPHNISIFNFPNQTQFHPVWIFFLRYHHVKIRTLREQRITLRFCTYQHNRGETCSFGWTIMCNIMTTSVPSVCVYHFDPCLSFVR